MVTIPPIKIVMAGGWFIIVLPTVFMIYFRTYSFEPADPQANMITLSCHPMEHGVSWLMTALWHPVMYPTVKSPNCRAIVLARDESSFELSNCTIIIFGLVVFLFNLPKTCHQGAHAVVAATGYSSLQRAGLHCIWDDMSWWFRKTSRKQWFKHPQLLVMYPSYPSVSSFCFK